jgi:hypothetical protein
MNLRLYRKSEAKKLPKPIQEYMHRKFKLTWEYINKLKCFESVKVIDEKNVRCICIYSPHLAQQQNISVMTTRDLNRHPEVVLYKGHIYENGHVSMDDLRTMSYPERLSARW